jgi:trimethylamine-N-oxide reductase (cytochrome c)
VCEVFLSSDPPKYMTWKQLLARGYFVVPPESKPEHRARSVGAGLPRAQEGRAEPSPLPSEYGEEYLRGLQTQSGKFELNWPASGAPEISAGRQPHIPVEGRSTRSCTNVIPATHFTSSTLQLSYADDGGDSFINDIEDHRVR